VNRKTNKRKTKESRDPLATPNPGTARLRQSFFFSEPEPEAHEEEHQLRHHHDGLHQPQQVVRRPPEQRRQRVPAWLPPPQRRRDRARQELPPRRRRRRLMIAAATAVADAGRLPPRRHALPHPLPHLARAPARHPTQNDPVDLKLPTERLPFLSASQLSATATASARPPALPPQSLLKLRRHAVGRVDDAIACRGARLHSDFPQFAGAVTTTSMLRHCIDGDGTEY
jgi:hypothetical protein